MSRWTETELAQVLADNPSLRLSRQNSPSVKYYIVTHRDPAAPSMVHRAGCAVLKRATHAKEWNRNPLLEDKWRHFTGHSCLSPEERKSPNNILTIKSSVADWKAGQGKATDGQSAPAVAAVSLNAAPKKRKYHNEPTVVNGIRFDSKKEAARYGELLLLEKAGEIWKIERQVPFELRHKSVLICRYVADFVYYDKSGKVVEDCKGVRTPVYKLKKKLMAAMYDIAIRET